MIRDRVTPALEPEPTLGVIRDPRTTVKRLLYPPPQIERSSLTMSTSSEAGCSLEYAVADRYDVVLSPAQLAVLSSRGSGSTKTAAGVV